MRTENQVRPKINCRGEETIALNIVRTLQSDSARLICVQLQSARPLKSVSLTTSNLHRRATDAQLYVRLELILVGTQVFRGITSAFLVFSQGI